MICTVVVELNISIDSTNDHDDHNFPAAHPHPQRLLDVFPAPVEHVFVVASKLVPELPANQQQATRQDRYLHFTS